MNFIETLKSRFVPKRVQRCVTDSERVTLLRLSNILSRHRFFGRTMRFESCNIKGHEIMTNNFDTEHAKTWKRARTGSLFCLNGQKNKPPLEK